MKEECPLCCKYQFIKSHIIIKKRIYHFCDHCEIIQLDRKQLLSPSEEKKRYLYHNNSLQNAEYMSYLRKIYKESIFPYLRKDFSILDYGSGSEPVFAQIMAKEGYKISYYDKYFAPDNQIFKELYNFIIAIEVLEHIHSINATFRKIISLLKPEGMLYLRTHFHSGNVKDFENWWYRQDTTHVSFFSKKTFEILASIFNLKIIKSDKNIEILLQKPINYIDKT